MQQDGSHHRRGLIFALIAYGLWGMLPIYYRMLISIDPVEVLSQRVVWSAAFLLIAIAARGQFGLLLATMRDRRRLAALTTSTMLIGFNWFVYLWSVTHDYIVATSLGYFLNPLLNVLIGVLFFGERLRPVQWFAIGLAALGVAMLGAGAPDMLGISLALALSFAVYGAVRKLTPVPPLIGLGVETVILFVPALAGLEWVSAHGGLGFGHNRLTTGMMIAGGLITSIPLLLFGAATRLLPMVTLGLIQYVTPTILFLTAVLLYGEHLSPVKWATFALIWTGLAIFAGDALYRTRRMRAATA